MDKIKKTIRRTLSALGASKKPAFGSSEASRIDLSLLDIIKNETTDRLRDAKVLEYDLLPKLGLNSEKTQFFPMELSSLFGKGLLIWQYPNQFSKYLVKLSSYKIESYMEIGVRHGGTFVTTVEYLNRFNPIRRAVAVDINDCPSVVAYSKLNSAASFLKMNTATDRFREYIKANPVLDLVLIDGDHNETGCRSDFEAVKERANMVVFHDIEPNAAPGVAKVWSDFKESSAASHDFFEFRDQYESVQGRWLGIGLAVRKSMPRNSSR